MSFRELPLSDIGQILRHWQAEQSIRGIAREIRVDRKTVARYVGAAAALGLPRDRPLHEEEVSAVVRRVRGRSSLERSAARGALASHKGRIVTWLGGPKPLRLSEVLALLRHDSITASYATLRRYVIAELGWRRRSPLPPADVPLPSPDREALGPR